MSRVRRTCAAGMAAVVLCAVMAAVPAGAQTVTVRSPELFVASASARALFLNLLGTQLTIGSSNALIDSSPKAQAQGAGVLLVSGTVANAEVTAPNQAQNPPPACVLNLPLGVINVTTACGVAQASTPNGLPQALGQGSIATLDLGQSLLAPLLDPLSQLLGQTLGNVVDPLLNLLGGLLNPLLATLNLNLANTVDQLIAGLANVTSVLAVRVGVASATGNSNAATASSQGFAEGAVIDVLPGLAPVTGAPLASIIVGQARANVTITRPQASETRVLAQAVPSFEAALVRVRLGIPILGPSLSDIPIGLGAPLTLLAGTPLASTISVGAGTTTTFPNGTVAAVADGVSLHLLQGLGNGGIRLDLAHAEAAGGGFSAELQIQQQAPPVTQPPPELSRTGGNEPWIPLGGAVLLVAAYGLRRATVRAVRVPVKRS